MDCAIIGTDKPISVLYSIFNAKTKNVIKNSQLRHDFRYITKKILCCYFSKIIEAIGYLKNKSVIHPEPINN